MLVTDTLISLVTPPPMRDFDGTVAVRSPGVHLTTITRYVAREAGYLKVEKYKFVGREVSVSDEDEDRLEEQKKVLMLARKAGQQKIPLRMALGMAWEDWAARLYPEMIWQPGELELDGVAMTPDGLGEDGAIDEFKCTYKSSLKGGSPRDIAIEWLWLAQVKAYCLRVESLAARLHVLYVNGGYRFDGGEAPEYRVYGLRFSEQELRANWGVVMRNKEKAWKEKQEEEKQKERREKRTMRITKQHKEIGRARR